MEHILEITGLNKSYPGFSLQDISFALPDGCITGFIGKNGAGKTTTLKSILGLVPKISGTIKWFGMDLSSNEKEIKERIGISITRREKIFLKKRGSSQTLSFFL